MGRMEGVPTVDKICRDELHLDDYVIARLKELIKLFRKAYEISEGVNFASEGMMDWTSSEISNMTAKFLDYDTNPHRSPRQRRFSAGEELWDPTKGYVLEFPSDKDE